MGIDVQLDQVLQRAQALVQGIDGRDGYHVRLKPGSVRLEPVNLLLVHESRVPMVTLELTDTGELSIHLGGHLEDRVVIALMARLNAPGNAYDRKTVAFAEFEADVERAFAADATLGGLATDMRVRQGLMMTADASSDLVLVLILIDVDLARDYGDASGA